MGNGADFGEFHLHLLYIFYISNPFQSTLDSEKDLEQGINVTHRIFGKMIRRILPRMGRTM